MHPRISDTFPRIRENIFPNKRKNNEKVLPRIRELKNIDHVQDGESDLLKAMKMIAKTGQGPKDQLPSMGCNIKWFKN